MVNTLVHVPFIKLSKEHMSLLLKVSNIMSFSSLGWKGILKGHVASIQLTSLYFKRDSRKTAEKYTVCILYLIY